MSTYTRTMRSRLLNDGATFTVTYWTPAWLVRQRELEKRIGKRIPPPMRKQARKHGRTMCPTTGKLRYGSELTAQRALAKAFMDSDPYRRESRAYLCPFCGMWHLTSKPRTRRTTV